MPKKLSKKYIALLVFLAIVALLIGFAYWSSQRAATGVVLPEKISDRGQEFVKNQQTTGTSVWNQHQITDAEQSNPPSSKTFQTPCFRVTIPYESVNQKVRSDGNACVLEAKVLEPPAQLVIRVATNSGDLSENSNLQMRLKDPKTYQQVVNTYPKFDESYHFIASDAVTLFLSQGTTTVTVALNSSGSQLKIDQTSLARLVDSILLTN